MAENEQHQFATRGELKDEVRSLRTDIGALGKSVEDGFERMRNSAPNHKSYALWATLILGIIYFLWSKESVAIEKKFDHIAEAPSRVMREYQGRLERLENERDVLANDKLRRYDDLVNEMLMERLSNGREQPEKKSP